MKNSEKWQKLDKINPENPLNFTEINCEMP